MDDYRMRITLLLIFCAPAIGINSNISFFLYRCHIWLSFMQFFGQYAKEGLGIHLNDLMALGRKDANNSSESFNMAWLAVRGSGAVNGVSRLHGAVSWNLFQDLSPRWSKEEVPFGHVTNGVHMPCWDSEYADQIWTEACGKHRWKGLPLQIILTGLLKKELQGKESLKYNMI